MEITLTDPENFLKVKETLSRIGIASTKSNTLYQTCHILHKRGRFFIMMFKELFALDRRPTDIELKDLQRRNTIAVLLEEWGLIEIIGDQSLCAGFAPLSDIKVLSHAESKDWTTVPKYTIGKSKSPTKPTS